MAALYPIQTSLRLKTTKKTAIRRRGLRFSGNPDYSALRFYSDKPFLKIDSSDLLCFMGTPPPTRSFLRKSARLISYVLSRSQGGG